MMRNNAFRLNTRHEHATPETLSHENGNNVLTICSSFISQRYESSLTKWQFYADFANRFVLIACCGVFACAVFHLSADVYLSAQNWSSLKITFHKGCVRLHFTKGCVRLVSFFFFRKTAFNKVPDTSFHFLLPRNFHQIFSSAASCWRRSPNWDPLFDKVQLAVGLLFRDHLQKWMDTFHTELESSMTWPKTTQKIGLQQTKNLSN